jgi:hypothetical protein
MDIAEILRLRFSGNEWILVGNNYSGLTWVSDTNKPTESQLQALWADVAKELAATESEITAL